MLELTPVLVMLIIFGFIYAIVRLGVKRKEHQALLERGADPTLFQEKPSEKFTSMKYGLFLIGIALGIFMGDVMTRHYDMQTEAAYFSMIFLFGGIALVLSYILGKNLDKKNNG